MPQDQEIRPVGGNKDVRVDVRVIAATNKDLEKEIAEGRFRQYLFYRLNVSAILIPPLRELSELYTDRILELVHGNKVRAARILGINR